MPIPDRRRPISPLLSALGVALGAWLGVQAVCLGLLRPVFLESYARIEANEARRDLARAAAAIEQLEARMVGSGRDWADWSAAYAYLRGTNPGFIRENLNPLHMDSMQLDVMLFTDPSGAAVHAEGYDLDRRAARSLSADDLAALTRDPRFTRLAAGDAPRATAVSLPSGPLLVAAFPVRTTEGAGPAAGGLLFGLRLGAATTAKLSHMVQLPVTLHLPASPAAAAALGATIPAPLVRTRGDDDLTVSAPLRGSDGRVAVIIEVRKPRAIWAQGVAAARALYGAVAVVTGLTALGLALLVEMARRAHAARRGVERRHAAFADHTGDAIVLAGADDLRVVDANRATAHITGRDAAGGTLAEALLADPASLDRALGEVRAGAPRAELSYSVLREGERRIDLDVTLTGLVVDGRRMIGAVARDVSERRRAEERDRHLAYHDALTGLPNRARFTEDLGRAIARARAAGAGFAVAFIDLDGFKEVNDTLGHETADRVLVEVAARLGRSTRSGDAVARLGGDEFLVLTPTLRTDQEAGRVAQRLLDAVREPYALDRGEVRVTASIGVAVYPRDGADATELIKSADVAMFAAKEAGRDGWQLFDRSMHERLRRVARIGANLAHALDRGEFELHYQPQVDARTGALVGVEALLRWNSPEGTVSPAEFVPIAEQTGIIVPIGEWVLRTAMRDALSWRDAGLGDVRVAVNLSARQFRDRQVVGVVLGALRDIPLPPALLELEITESLAMRNPEQARQVIEQLNAEGVSWALDDFGTGYSSLAYLQQFPIHRLKIDRVFLEADARNRAHGTIIAAIIELAHALHLEVVAEGVETAAQLAMLTRGGCDLLQGYGLSRPMTAGNVRALLASQERLLDRLGRRSSRAAQPRATA